MKTVIFIILTFCSCFTAIADDFDVPSLRMDEFGGTLGQIDSRMRGGPGYPWQNYRDNDKVTWAHEGTHSVNARIRIDSGVQNGYYLLDNHGITLKRVPNLTLRQVAQAVPRDKRGKIYNLYLVQQTRDWNDTPLYVLDELTCYVNGAVVGIEYEMTDRATQSYNYAMEMWEYSKVAHKLCRDRNYSDIDEFTRYMRIIEKRLKVIRMALQ